MTLRPLSLLLIAAWGVAGVAFATTVYKSVDEDGNVTYSMTPPPDAVSSRRVQVSGGQPDAEAEARLGAAREDLERSAAEGANRDKALREARSALAKAREGLAEARKVTDDDWFGTYGPYRRLKPAYYERVRDAEAAIANAELAVERNCTSGCEDLSWKIDLGGAAAFTPSGNVRHAEARHVEIDAEGRRIGHADARREVQAAQDRREVQSAQARREVQQADDRREVWNASGRTTVRDAEARREVR